MARSVDKLEAVRKEIVASGGSALVVPCDITGEWIVLALSFRIDNVQTSTR